MKKFLPFSFLMLLFILAGCKKDDDGDNNPPPAGPIEIWENVHVIDSTNMVLDINASNFSSGTYVFNSSGTPPTINVNDVIVGATGYGYIRIVNAVSINGNVITLQTSQGRMEDVFKNGSFNFTLDMNDMNPGKTNEGFSHTLSNVVLYDQDGLNLELLEGSVSFDPNWNIVFAFTPAGIDTFEISTTNTEFSATANVKATASEAVTLFDESDTLLSYSKLIVQMVGEVPVVMLLDVNWIADYSADIAASITSTANFSTSSSFNLGMRYAGSQWQGIYDVTPTNNLTVTQPTGNVELTLNYAWRPQVSLTFYSVLSPYLSVSPTTEVKGTVASPSLDWDLKADAWLKSTVGIDVSILGYSLLNYNNSWETSKLTYRKPDRIERISGDNQTGEPNQPLPEPLKVRILDSEGYPQSGVPVYFSVTEGGGFVSPEVALSDTNGFAEVTYTLGPLGSSLQYVEASANYGDGSLLNNAPVDFASTSNTNSDCTGTIIDSDGNVYNIVSIGNQCWMAENLRVSAGIDQVDSADWANIDNNSLQTPAWCYYAENSGNGSTYGKLYNWYAVNTGNLCPSGWHIPTDTDWMALRDYLGGGSVAGGAMKDTILWNFPNTGATNSSGFSALPGGSRGSLGNFLGIGAAGVFWSSTESNGWGWRSALQSIDSYLDIYYTYKNSGFSCRCVKD